MERKRPEAHDCGSACRRTILGANGLTGYRQTDTHGRDVFTVKLDDDAPTVADVCRHLGVSEGDIDPAFGVVLIDPDDKRYAVMVDEAVVAKTTRADVAGPFSNPRIETTGPPEPATPPRSRPRTM